MLKTKKIFRFTLVELIVSMAVFALLSMMVVQLFSATQKLWVNDVHKNELSSDGRMALDLIASLLTSACSSPDVSNDTEKDPIGCDFFYLYKGSESVSVFDPQLSTTKETKWKETSQLRFATKTSHPGMTHKDTVEKVRFVGIQVASISGSSDPDNGRDVLTVVNFTDKNGGFQGYFPDSSDVKNVDFSTASKRSFADVVQTESQTAYQVSRIASNVVDFQVVAYSSLSNLESGNGDSNISELPVALEVTLVLMDKTHYDIYHDSETDSDAKKLLYDQYARTFRRTIFLNGDVRTENVGDSISKAQSKAQTGN